MDRLTRIFLIICLVAFCSSFVVQTAFQFLGAERSVWGGNPGWQREIAFWNVGAAIIVFLTLRLGECAAERPLPRQSNACCDPQSPATLFTPASRPVALSSVPGS